MAAGDDQTVARMSSFVDKAMSLIEHGKIAEEGFSNMALLPGFRDEPLSVYAIAGLFPDAPIYGAFMLQKGLDDAAIARRIRNEIPTYAISEEVLSQYSQIRGEFILEDSSPGTLNYDVLWKMMSDSARARNLPIAFIAYGKYIDDGGECVILFFPTPLMPDDVLAHFRSAIGTK